MDFISEILLNVEIELGEKIISIEQISADGLDGLDLQDFRPFSNMAITFIEYCSVPVS